MHAPVLSSQLRLVHDAAGVWSLWHVYGAQLGHVWLGEDARVHGSAGDIYMTSQVDWGRPEGSLRLLAMRLAQAAFPAMEGR